MEIVEPPDIAVSAIARALREVKNRDEEAWLIVFLDLLDKAGRAEPHEHLLAAVQAALASAPADDKQIAREATLEFERAYRREGKSGAPLKPAHRAEREVLLVIPKRREREACAAAFDATSAEPQAFDSHVRYRRFPLPDKEQVVVTMVCLQEAGNLPASHVIRDYISAFGRPDLAVLCGMAMGTTDEISTGDVVVASDILDYQPRRVTAEGSRSRFRMYSPPSPLWEDLKEHGDSGQVLAIQKFHEVIEGMVEQTVELPPEVADASFEPKYHLGVILAGEELVEDDSGEERASIHDRAYALEMESAGFAATCHHMRLDWGVVRGVADFGAPDRGKGWQSVATIAAATFVRTFLEKNWLLSRA